MCSKIRSPSINRLYYKKQKKSIEKTKNIQKVCSLQILPIINRKSNKKAAI